MRKQRKPKSKRARTATPKQVYKPARVDRPGQQMATDIADKLGRPLLADEASYLRMAAAADGVKLTIRRYDFLEERWIDVE